MAINIKNQEAERLLEQLSKKRGIGKTQLVLELLRREAAHESRLRGTEQRRKRIEAIAARAARKIGSNPPSHEEVLGYDESGLPTR